MTHRMMLVSHDFKEVKAMVVAKRKDSSRVGVDGNTSDPYSEIGGSIPPLGSINEMEKWNTIFEKLDGA